MKGLLLVIGLIVAIPVAIVMLIISIRFEVPEWITEIVFYILIGTPVAGLLAIKCKARSERLRVLAEKHAWEFSENDSLVPESSRSHFASFNYGRSSIRNTMRTSLKVNDQSLDTVLGDCEYTSSRRGFKRDYRKSFVLVSFPYQFMERATIRPENVLDRIADKFGFDDIDFESKQFSDAFHVTGSDKRLMYEIMSPRMMEFLLKDHPSARAVTIEIAYSRLCITTEKQRWKPEEFPQALRWARELLEHWPARLFAPRRKSRQ